MNDLPDNLDTALPGANASNGAIDPALAVELETFFVARRSPPPDPEAFWKRLAPHLEPREESAASPAPSAHAAVLPAPPSPDSSRRPARGGHGLPARRPPASRARRGISGIAAIAAVLLISLAAFALFHQLGLVASNGQAIQRGQLTWHLVKLPSGVVLAEGVGVTEYQPSQPTPAGTPASARPNASLTVASANGDVAYICQIPASGSVLLWRTTDAGRDWSRLPDPPATGTFKACGMQTDENDALTVIVVLATPSDTATSPTFYVLFDGTAHWRQLSEVAEPFASSRGIYYGIRNVASTANPAGSARQPLIGHLYVSSNHMVDWQAIDAPLMTENLAAAHRLKLNGAIGVWHIWAQPLTGELLAQTYDGVLWRSTTGGADWVQIKLPALPPAAELTPMPGEMLYETGEPPAAIVYVQQPVADHPFTLCALVLDQQLTVYNIAPLYCSTDSGQTWTRRPRPAVMQGSGKPDQFEMPSVMLPDGSLLSWDVTTIYRMPGNSATAPAGFVVGTIPPPHDPNSIPGGFYGVTAHGVTLWQPLDTQTLYVARYTITPAK